MRSQQKHSHSQHTDRNRLKRLLTPECHQAAPGAGGQSRSADDRLRPQNLLPRNAPQQPQQRKYRPRCRQQYAHVQQTGQQFPQRQLVVAQVRHQQQDQSLSVLLLSHYGGRKQCRKEQAQRQLQQCKDSEHQRTERRDVTRKHHVLKADRCLPQTVKQYQQPGHKPRTHDVVAETSRSRQDFPLKDRSYCHAATSRK